jgi:hypothetical protein
MNTCRLIISILGVLCDSAQVLVDLWQLLSGDQFLDNPKVRPIAPIGVVV